MHRDNKERNRAVKEMANRQTSIPKHPDPDTLKRFREVPYQLRYGKEKKDAEQREKYAKEIIEIACNGGNIAVVNGKLENCRKTQCNECNFNGGTIRDCEIKTRKWANSEYVEPIEPPVDWSKVPVDTPVLVTDRKDAAESEWKKRYFAKYENGMVYTWANGATSWSGEIVSSWMYAKLAESEEVNRILAEEEKTGGWIPVTERLPDPETEVLITARRKYKSGGCVDIITTALYEDGNMLECDSCWDWVDIDGEYDEENDCYIIPEGWWEDRHFNPDEVYNNLVDDEVIAWMPLPEPYRESEEQDGIWLYQSFV